MVYSTPEKNPFFALPVGIIRRRAQLPPPLPGQPGPFSLGGEGVLARALEQAGFGDVQVRKIDSPLRPLDGLQYDVFFSRIVLQHNPPPLMAAVLRSALAGLRPGGNVADSRLAISTPSGTTTP